MFISLVAVVTHVQYSVDLYCYSECILNLQHSEQPDHCLPATTDDQYKTAHRIQRMEGCYFHFYLVIGMVATGCNSHR